MHAGSALFGVLSAGLCAAASGRNRSNVLWVAKSISHQEMKLWEVVLGGSIILGPLGWFRIRSIHRLIGTERKFYGKTGQMLTPDLSTTPLQLLLVVVGFGALRFWRRHPPVDRPGLFIRGQDSRKLYRKLAKKYPRQRQGSPLKFPAIWFLR